MRTKLESPVQAMTSKAKPAIDDGVLAPGEDLSPRAAYVARRRRRSTLLAVGLATTGPVLAIVTYATLTTSDPAALSSLWFKALILADILYLVVLVGLIGLQLARLIVARRANSAGSRLHGRMVAFFTGVAAAPAILVAAFFFLVIQLGFEAWFSDQVSSVVRSSQELAEAYAEEHREAIRGEAVALSRTFNRAAEALSVGPRNPAFWRAIEGAVEQSRFDAVYILNATGGVVARDPSSFLFGFTPPTYQDLTQAQRGAVVLREDAEQGEIRALLRLDALFDEYLYLTRSVGGDVRELVERTERAASLYRRLEENRESWIAQFAVLYLGFVVLVLMAAIYLGLWFAERVTRPIGRLASAAQRVRSGDLVTRVKEEQGDDEIALLSRVFNRMTEEVQRKQRALTAAHADSEARRIFTETVLSGVTPGVVGLDADGRILLLNSSASELLALSPDQAVGAWLVDAAPEFAALFADAEVDQRKGIERPLRLVRGDREIELLARVTAQRAAVAPSDDARTGEPSSDEGPPGIVGYVVTLDDLTALVAAQRMAAWGDVARRIAHEIKNPLTPIQLAAERLRRKYRDRLGDDGEVFDRYTDTIVRQTGDIGRMVDAFVRFAKMPAPTMAQEDCEALLREAVLLQEEARPQIRYRVDAPAASCRIRADRGQLIQALTNLLQNAADSLHAALGADAEAGLPPRQAEVRVSMREEAGTVVLSISDNGVGLPAQDRRRLLEPYVTTREKGAGLGLAIVAKIVEEHGGVFSLGDAEPFEDGAAPGACAQIALPIAGAAPTGAEADEASTTDEPKTQSHPEPQPA